MSSWLLPLGVAIPLAGAALIAAAGEWLPGWVHDAIAVAASATTCGFMIALLLETERRETLHWFGGWSPRHGVALGIAFTAGPFSAGIAALAAGLVTASLVFSWSYMRAAGRFYRTLMLAFCGALCGFALSGDLFNMFVWFELMGVAAYALAGYNIERLGPLQGAINFAVTNSIGSFMFVFGIALLYGRTGALNLAQIGKALDGHAPDKLTIVAFALIVSGFLIKSAIVPFHMWLADAYAVAPAPVCVVLSGVMSELGIYAVARVYWTCFAGSFGGHAADVRSVLVWLGLVSALLAGFMAFLQRHLKRMLAYVTINEAAIGLVGVGLLGGRGLAGAAHIVLSGGFLRGGLFLACGVLLQRLRSIDELRLRGRGRALPWLALLFALGGLGLIGAPYVGTFTGHSLIDDAASADGHGWIPPLVTIAGMLSAAAVLRAGARIFLGWGAAEDPLLTPEPPEEPPDREETQFLPMIAATAVLIVPGFVLSVAPGLEDRLQRGAERFRDHRAYLDFVLHGRQPLHGRAAPYVVHAASGESVAYALAALVGTLALAWLGLHWQRAPAALRALGARTLGPGVRGLKAVHSGIPGDYAMWATVGAAVLGGVWALTLR